MEFSITVKPKLNRVFYDVGHPQRWHWDNISNCYGYAIGCEKVEAVNLGSLCSGNNQPQDNDKLLSVEGLQELLLRDGWLKLERINMIDAKNMHTIGVFGFRPIGVDFNEFHCFRMDTDGTFSEKPGRGLKIRCGSYTHPNTPLTADNLVEEYNKHVANSVSDPVFSGFYQMPEEGLRIHPSNFRKGTPELMAFYPFYS